MKTCKKIAAQKKAVEDYEKAAENHKYFQSLKRSWAKLIKRGKLQPVSFWRNLSFMMPSDRPVDMAQIWNWMVTYNRKEAKAYHAAVSVMLDEAIKEYAGRMRALCK